MNDKNVLKDALQMRNGTGKTTTLLLIQRLVTNQTLEYDDTLDMNNEDVLNSNQGRINQLLRRSRYSGLAGLGHIERSEIGDPKFSLTMNVNGRGLP